MKWLLALSLLTVSALSALAADCDRGHSDGCSIPGGLNFFYKKTFTPDCHKHDQCYFCGVSSGVTRKQCDQRFYANLQRHCDKLPRKTNGKVNGDKAFCESVRSTYYLAVRVGGTGGYRTKPEPWCKESWVKQCIQ